MTEGGSLLNTSNSSRRLMSSGLKNLPTEDRTAERVEGVTEPSGRVALGSYRASEPRLEVRQMMVFLKFT
jgi:hypothetical protein